MNLIVAVDAKGLSVPTAEPLVGIKIEGPAHLVGMDAGNLRDLSLYSASGRKMFAGALLAVVMADAPGKVTVTFEAESLETSSICFEIK